MIPPIPLHRAAELVRDGKPHYACCGTALGREHIPECVHFKAIRHPSEQCLSCSMIGFHHVDCENRLNETPENPRYYEHASGVESIEVNRHMTFNAGSAFKYLIRYEGKTNPPEDLRKARWYVADMEAYEDSIWIKWEAKNTARPLMEKMIAAETNGYRVRFLEAMLDLDVDGMASAIEDAREAIAGDRR